MLGQVEERLGHTEAARVVYRCGGCTHHQHTYSTSCGTRSNACTGARHASHWLSAFVLSKTVGPVCLCLKESRCVRCRPAPCCACSFNCCHARATLALTQARHTCSLLWHQGYTRATVNYTCSRACAQQERAAALHGLRAPVDVSRTARRERRQCGQGTRSIRAGAAQEPQE